MGPAHAQTDAITDYVHEPLMDFGNQIRVLSLLPAPEFEHTIHCELSIVAAPIESAYWDDKTDDHALGDYEAVSYAWGNTALTRSVFVRGKRLKVTQSLEVALRYLRYTHRERLLWMDAICIDQSHDEEKSQQVRILRRIFGRARQVLVWLGPGDDETDYAMRQIGLIFDAYSSGNGSLSRVLEMAGQDDVCREGVNRILARAWWSRLWTMVELTFARRMPHFGCGRHWTAWAAIENAGGLGFPARVLRAPLLAALFKSADSLRRERGLLEHCLIYLNDCQATDPRDYVFAIAGMLPWTMQQLGFPNYGLSISEVYQRTTVAILSSNKLSRNRKGNQSAIYIRGSRHLDLPSWCIDFSQPKWRQDEDAKSALGRRSFLHPPSSFALNFMESTTLEHDFSQSLLMMEGIEIGHVDGSLRWQCNSEDVVNAFAAFIYETSEESSSSCQISTAKAALKDWIRHLLPFREGIERRQQMRCGGGFWSTLTQGWRIYQLFSRYNTVASGRLDASQWSHVMQKSVQDRIEFQFPDYGELERHFTDALSAAQEAQEASPADCIDWLSPIDLRALAVVAVGLEGSVLFVTERGYFGRCASCAREGDIVALLSDSMCPTVLRPNEDATCQFVSHAYMRGIMIGSNDEELEGLERKRFYLK